MVSPKRLGLPTTISSKDDLHRHEQSYTEIFRLSDCRFLSDYQLKIAIMVRSKALVNEYRTLDSNIIAPNIAVSPVSIHFMLLVTKCHRLNNA